MADLLPDTEDATDVRPERMRPDRRSTPGTPRWVKVSGIIALVLILLLVIMVLVGGGNHGPGRHIPSGGAGGHRFGTTPLYVTTMPRYTEWLPS